MNLLSPFRPAFRPMFSHEDRASPAMRPVVKALGDIVIRIDPMGSRVTCDPAPVGTDEDWLMLTDSNPARGLKGLGFVQDGSPQFYTGNSDGGFRSWRKGDLNVVTTDDHDFYNRFMTATHLAKRFNLLDKNDRIALFQAVLYGVDARYLQDRTDPRTQALPVPATA